tara:strand:+ start:745 stop:1047 length:303 start_codon:yes stop_codon:yes gene_type:complete
MASRYKNQKILVDMDTSKRYLSRIKYPVIPSRDSDIRIISKQGQSLLTLANEYYGDPNLYWIISRRNNITNTLFPTIGTELFIPVEMGEIMSALSRLNRI